VYSFRTLGNQGSQAAVDQSGRLILSLHAADAVFADWLFMNVNPTFGESTDLGVCGVGHDDCRLSICQ
jgi:hypothetical protein